MDNPPSLEEWRRLYEATSQVKALAPWQWMSEDDLFGVQDPESGQIGFISVMGAMGLHYAISVYLGAEGLYGFYDLQQYRGEAERLFEIHTLQVSFEHREMVAPEDRKVMQQLGLKFRGKNAWPIFRSFHPGYYPWFLTAGEARFLTLVLEQVLAVAPLVKENPQVLDPFNDDRYLIKVPTQEKERLVWTEQHLSILEPEPPKVRAEIDQELMKRLKGLRRSTIVVEMDLFLITNPLMGSQGRPYFPYFLAMADSRSGQVLGFTVLTPEPSLAEMRATLPQNLAVTFIEFHFIPKEIHVWERRGFLLEAFKPLKAELGIEVTPKASLKCLDYMKDVMYAVANDPRVLDFGDLRPQ